MPKRLSFQLYSARKFEPLADTLKLLAQTGYREVEGYDAHYGDPQGLRAELDRHGLSMPTGHFGLKLLEQEKDRAVFIAHTLGIRHIYAPYVPPEERPKTAAGWRKFGGRLAAIGEWAHGEGFSFGWHNHDFEVVNLPSGEKPLELLFSAAPALDWECDVAWIARAGVNPLTLIKRHAPRITAVHIKDIAAKGDCLDEDGWADAGHGTLDWPSIFRELRKSRTLHFIMEHDNPSNHERFAKRSFAYVSEI